MDKIELALGGREQSYFEVEFELKAAGTEEHLAQIADGLSREWHLKPEPRSKFARALDLANQSGL